MEQERTEQGQDRMEQGQDRTGNQERKQEPLSDRTLHMHRPSTHGIYHTETINIWDINTLINTPSHI